MNPVYVDLWILLIPKMPHNDSLKMRGGTREFKALGVGIKFVIANDIVPKV